MPPTDRHPSWPQQVLYARQKTLLQVQDLYRAHGPALLRIPTMALRLRSKSQGQGAPMFCYFSRHHQAPSLNPDEASPGQSLPVSQADLKEGLLPIVLAVKD